MSLPWWSWWKWRLRQLVRSGRCISWDLWGFLFFLFGEKRAKLKNLIADPKLAWHMGSNDLCRERCNSVGSQASLWGLSSWTDASLVTLSFWEQRSKQRPPKENARRPARLPQRNGGAKPLFSRPRKLPLKKLAGPWRGRRKGHFLPRSPQPARGMETRSGSRAPRLHRCSKTTLRSQNSPGMSRGRRPARMKGIKCLLPFSLSLGTDGLHLVRYLQTCSKAGARKGVHFRCFSSPGPPPPSRKYPSLFSGCLDFGGLFVHSECLWSDSSRKIKKNKRRVISAAGYPAKLRLIRHFSRTVHVSLGICSLSSPRPQPTPLFCFLLT